MKPLLILITNCNFENFFGQRRETYKNHYYLISNVNNHRNLSEFFFHWKKNQLRRSIFVMDIFDNFNLKKIVILQVYLHWPKKSQKICFIVNFFLSNSIDPVSILWKLNCMCIYIYQEKRGFFSVLGSVVDHEYINCHFSSSPNSLSSFGPK